MPKKKKASGSNSNKPQRMGQMRPGGGEDAMRRKEVQEYVRLLGDPCNAEMVMPPFQGSGTNQFIRTKTLFTVGPSAVDAIVQFAPQFISTNGGPAYATQAVPSPILWASSNSTGTGMNTIYAQPIATTVFGGFTGAASVRGLASNARCIAACVKVHYLGTELNRSGQIAATLGPGTFFGGNSPSGGAAIDSAVTTASQMPQIDRVGERVHEYRWVPNSFDQSFAQLSGAIEAFGGEPGLTGDYGGNTLTLACYGVPAGSLQFEVVAVWEYELNLIGGTGLTRTISSPPRGTLNEALRMLGNIGQWALEPAGQTVIGAFSPSLAMGIRAAGAAYKNFG